MKLAFYLSNVARISAGRRYGIPWLRDLGFDGIEIRGLGDDIFAVKAKPFTDEQLPKTVGNSNP